MSRLRNVAATARRQVRRSAALYWVYSAVNPRLRDGRVTRKTDLVMDGFPRTAGSYALLAFLQVNDPGLRLTSHHHNAFALIRGAKLKRPTVLLVRRPGDLVNSLLHFHEGLKSKSVAELHPEAVVAEWIDFHERLLPHLDRMLVADFAEVTADFGQVVEACNALFGTHFAPYEKSEANETAVREKLDAVAEYFITGENAEKIVGRPSEQRTNYTPAKVEDEPEIFALLERATALYERILSEAPHKVGHNH